MTEVQIENTPWQIFDKVYYKDESTTQYEYVQYKERNVNVVTLSEYSLINQDLDVPLLISDSFLQVKCSIRSTADITVRVGESDIAFNNNGWNIFQRAQYYMNDQLIEDIDEVGVTTLVKGLIDFSKAYSESACNELWELDTNSLDLVAGAIFPLTATANAVATTLAINVNGELITGAGATTNAATIVRNGVNLAVSVDGGNATQALAIQGGAQNIDFGAPVPGGSSIVLRTTQNNKDTDLALYAFFDGSIHEIFLTGNRVHITAVYEKNGKLINCPAIAAGQILCQLRTERSSLWTNHGYQERVLRTRQETTATANKSVNLFLPINRVFKLFDYNRHVFRGVKHTIRLYKNLSNKSIFSKTIGPNGQLSIDDISWWVPALRPSIDYGLMIDKQLNSGLKTKLQWNQLRTFVSPLYTANIGRDSTGYWRITSAGNKPVRIFIVFRYENQYASGGDQASFNAMTFKHMSITNIHVRINSLQFPKEEFICDFDDTDDYLRVYLQYLQCSGHIYDTSSGGYAVCYDEFKTVYPMFCFDLSKQDPSIWANVTQAELELRFKRNPVIPAGINPNFTIYAVIEFEKSLSIVGVDNRLRIEM